VKLKVHPSIKHAAAILNSLPEKTGKSVDEWAKLLAEAGMTTSKSMARYLRDHYDIARPTATILFAKINNIRHELEAEAYLEYAPTRIDKQYTGGKAHLRPLAELLFAELDKLGADVGASPCKTFVPFYRQHVFAQVKAATQKRIDVGLALACYDGQIPERLKDTGGAAKGDRITHVIGITAPEEIDAELIQWMRTAYELDE